MGCGPPSVGRALAELDIGSNLPHQQAPPGQGPRRSGPPGTAQGRLVIELRLAGAVDRASAERVLAEFLSRYNERFAVMPADPEPAWRPLPSDLDLDAVCAFRYERVVANDATVRIGGLVLDLPRQRGGRSLAGKRVEVRLELDGRLVVADGPPELFAALTDMDPGHLRDLEKGRFSLRHLPTGLPRAAPGYAPSTNHPWRRATPGSKLEAIQREERRLTESPNS